MEPKDEHTFYMWVAIIAIISCIALIGAIIDRIAINRALKKQAFRSGMKSINPDI
jgi:lipoprotein